jgi:hypothetical protein
MTHTLTKILTIFNNDLKKYKHIENNKINNYISNGSYIIYISNKYNKYNNKYLKRKGIVVNIINNIIYLTNINKTSNWSINIDDYYIFLKIKKSDKLRYMLRELLDSDFSKIINKNKKIDNMNLDSDSDDSNDDTEKFYKYEKQNKYTISNIKLFDENLLNLYISELME